MQLTREGCRHRPVDCSPVRFFSADVDRGVHVRIQRKATSLAKERLLGLPVRLLTMPTSRAGAAGIARVYQMQRHARPGGLVGEELAKLVESPGMPFVAMCVTDRYALADSRQILQSECLARDGGFLDQGFADTGLC